VQTGLFPGPSAQPRRRSLARRHHRHPSHGGRQIGDALTGSEAIPPLRRRTGGNAIDGTRCGDDREAAARSAIGLSGC